MDRWRGKVAVVTGASSGIGLATVKELVSYGLIVVGFARRKERMENEMENSNGPGIFFARWCDIGKEENIIENLNWVKKTLGTINVLVNNAGTIHYKSLEGATIPELEEVINVNFRGVMLVTKHAISILKKNQKEAHIINVTCVLGHKTPSALASMNVYPATKCAIAALTETLSVELKDSNIRVSCITSDMVETEMVDKIILAETPSILLNNPALDSEDVASAIVYALSAPVHVEINDIIIQPKAC